MTYRLDYRLYPNDSDPWLKKVIFLASAVIVAVEEKNSGVPGALKREEAIELFLRYAEILKINIPYVPAFIEKKIITSIAGAVIDRLARLVKRLRSGV